MAAAAKRTRSRDKERGSIPLVLGRVPRATDTLRQKTLLILREAIASGQIKPDERLVERDICERTGVSRSSVREALRYLESEGLVESRGAKGMFAVNLSAGEAMEIYELRIAVETMAATRFAERASDDEIRRLLETFASVKIAAATDAEKYWRQADLLLDIVMHGARNSVAYGLMRALRTRMRYLRSTTTRFATLAYRQGTVAHLAALTDALARRDGPAAAARMRVFVARSARFAAECLARRDVQIQSDGAPRQRAFHTSRKRGISSGIHT
jgi:GntR family transcriptional regulator, trigonelline degradation regulator